jgi:TM2 domain-containing membrane protein YozV
MNIKKYENIFLFCFLINFSFCNTEIKNNTDLYFNLEENTLNSECNPTYCNLNGSQCINNQCVCKNCYLSIILPNDHRKCNYNQYVAFKAATLEFLFFCGIGHFYLKNYFTGFLKFLYFYASICGAYIIVVYSFMWWRTYQKNRNNGRDSNLNNYNSSLKGDFQYVILTDRNRLENSINILRNDYEKIHRLTYAIIILYVIVHLIDVYFLAKGDYKDENNLPVC